MSHGKPWIDARTPLDLGICTADWLERKIRCMPTRAHYQQVQPETERLVPLLAALNRSGRFVTTNSQPGCTPDRRAWGGVMPFQRAAVMGFVPASKITEVRAALTRQEILLIIAAPGMRASRATMMVSRRPGSQGATYFGAAMSAADIAYEYEAAPDDPTCPGLHPKMIRALQECYQVAAADRRWGRNSVLWQALQQLV